MDNTAGAFPYRGRLERRSQQKVIPGGNGRGGRGNATAAGAVAVDTVVNRPLLNDDEVSLVLGAILSQQERITAGEEEVRGTDIFVSIPSFWNLLTHFDPLLLDEEAQKRLEHEQVGPRAMRWQEVVGVFLCALMCHLIYIYIFLQHGFFGG